MEIHSNSCICYQSLFNHPDAHAALASFVFLPIEALINVVMNKNEAGGSSLAHKYQVQFRLRCVFMQQLFHTYELLGLRADVPDCYSRFNNHQWMNKDFLSIKEMKQSGEGSQYSASNIPVAIAMIIHFIGTGDITIPLNLKTLTRSTGAIKKELPSDRDFRESIDLKFRFQGLYEGHLSVKLDQAILILIYGCNPFDKPKENETFPRKDVCALFKKLESVPFKEMMNPVLAGAMVKTEAKILINPVVTGFLPDAEYKSIVAKFESPGTTAKVKEEEILEMLKNKEKKYLAISCNLRFHINVIETKKLATANASSVTVLPFSTENNQEEDDQSDLLTWLEQCRFLKKQVARKKTKKKNEEEDEDEDVSDSDKIADMLFPEYLLQMADKIGNLTQGVWHKTGLPAEKSYAEQWLFLKKQKLEWFPPRNVLTQSTHNDVESTVVDVEQSARSPPIPRKNTEEKGAPTTQTTPTVDEKKVEPQKDNTNDSSDEDNGTQNEEEDDNKDQNNDDDDDNMNANIDEVVDSDEEEDNDQTLADLKSPSVAVKSTPPKTSNESHHHNLRSPPSSAMMQLQVAKVEKELKKAQQAEEEQAAKKRRGVAKENDQLAKKRKQKRK